MYHFAKYIGIDKYLYSSEELYNMYLLDIKTNLKHTKTLKKQFYFPSKNELLNKKFMIELKKKSKINVEELKNIKNKLQKVKKI